MVNELKEICDKLAGYSLNFVVLAATQNANGDWELTVRRVKEKQEESEVAEDADE